METRSTNEDEREMRGTNEGGMRNGTRSTNEDERETRGTNEGECRNEKRETRMYFWATVLSSHRAIDV